MLILTCANLHEKVRLYVAYTKMTKYSYDTIMVNEVLFTEIGNYSFIFLCRSHIVVFLSQILNK
jgi:hypothetical protein